ncbi:MAG: archease [bacterium]|nr:archease [bacterium]
MVDYETFSTTADVGIRVRGKGYRELFQNAVKGLNLLYFDELPEGPRAGDRGLVDHFEYRGDSCENVLVNFLSEVVFLLQIRESITVGIDFQEIEETYIKADLLTIPLDWEPGLEVKSVTYHNLRVVEKAGIKYGENVVDI